MMTSENVLSDGERLSLTTKGPQDHLVHVGIGRDDVTLWLPPTVTWELQAADSSVVASDAGVVFPQIPGMPAAWAELAHDPISPAEDRSGVVLIFHVSVIVRGSASPTWTVTEGDTLGLIIDQSSGDSFALRFGAEELVIETSTGANLQAARGRVGG
jgi:hypothetical protein